MERATGKDTVESLTIVFVTKSRRPSLGRDLTEGLGSIHQTVDRLEQRKNSSRIVLRVPTRGLVSVALVQVPSEKSRLNSGIVTRNGLDNVSR